MAAPWSAPPISDEACLLARTTVHSDPERQADRLMKPHTLAVLRELQQFVRKTFKTTVRVFLDALKLSPNAQGYVRGSVSELLLKEKLEAAGYEVERVREKWEGPKHRNHHGDFYVRRNPQSSWFVIESKGVKSNSEKWHKLYNYEQLRKFLFQHRELIPWIEPRTDIDGQIKGWIDTNLPEFTQTYRQPIYDYEEVQKYVSGKKQTAKSLAIQRLRNLDREEIAAMIDERLTYLGGRLNVLETHFVSSARTGGRTQATPRADEFGLVCVDIALKYPEHTFLYVNPRNLERSSADTGHLQQNYVIGLVFKHTDGSLQLSYEEDFTNNLAEAFGSLQPDQAVRDEDRQVDRRAYPVSEEES